MSGRGDAHAKLILMMRPPQSEALAQRMEWGLGFMDAYFTGASVVHRAAEEIARRLEAAGIDYAIAGALSLNAYGYMRATVDVDVIVTREGLARFKAEWLGRGYVNLRAGGKPVRDAENNVQIDFLLAGDFPGDGKPKPVAIPVPDTVSVSAGKYRVISLPCLVELKLASGMTAPHRLKDLADIQELIGKASIPRDLVEQLNPYVRDKFLELWDAAQHPDDEY